MFEDALIISSLIGTALIVLLMYLDRYEQEKVALVAKVFFFSIFFTCIYGIIKGFLFNFDDTTMNFEMYIFAPITEELYKFVFLYILVKKRPKEVNESFDAIVYLGIIAIGFSVYENIGYYINYTQGNAVFSAISDNPIYYQRAFKDIPLIRLVPGHLLIDVSSIIVVGYSLKYGKKNLPFVISYIIAVILHFLWNFLSRYSGNIFLPYVIMLIIGSIISVGVLLKISRFEDNPPIEIDDYGISDKEKYNWGYYLLFFFFLLCVAISGILAADIIERIL
jgi:protease PrsW